MGHILGNSASFLSSLSEDSGARSGITLSKADILAHLPEEHPLRQDLAGNRMMRVQSETYADTVGDLLFSLGTTDEPGMPTLGMRFIKNLGSDWQNHISIDEMMTISSVANHYLHIRHVGKIERSTIFAELRQLTAGKPDALEKMLEAMKFHLAFCPFFTRDLAIKGRVSLDHLFISENLPPPEQGYFDQRFINYLANQPHQLGSIHWRQFEGLTAEWFQRNGYDVVLGQGRNDGSVDVRVWRRDVTPGSPPSIIVQCKRQGRKIERVVVKALYADILNENSESGMVVTTSDLSPGAAADISARAYPITTANRQQVGNWIRAMRQPNAGIVIEDIQPPHNDGRPF